MNTVRKIITINEELCNGCGECITGCPEGAIALVDGKAKLTSDIYCDGLGACLGECPTGAISITEREAAPYDEKLVIANIVKQGPTAVQQHLQHLQEHGETEYLKQAMEFLNTPIATTEKHCGCPGSTTRSFGNKASNAQRPQEGISPKSALTHWPVQMHLIQPTSAHFQGSDVVLSADCVAFSLGDFHGRFLNGKTLAIACPKLDDGQDVYRSKITALIDQAKINTLTVMIMQVPCCGGLLQLALTAAKEASRRIPIKAIVVGVEGDILKEDWVSA